MFLIVCFHFSRRLLDRRRHKTNKGRTNRRSLPNCQQNGRIAARHGRLAFRDRAFWQKMGHPAARRRCGQRRRCTGRWHGAGQRNGGGGAGGGGAGGGGAPAVGTGAGRRRGCTGGDAGVPAAKRRGGSRKGKTPADGTDEPAAKRRGGGEKEGRRQKGKEPAGGTAEKILRPMAQRPAGGTDEPSAKRRSGKRGKFRPMARRAAAQKKACAAAGLYPEVRTTYIIGSVRRGYALQRRESSCRPT